MDHGRKSKLTLVLLTCRYWRSLPGALIAVSYSSMPRARNSILNLTNRSMQTHQKQDLACFHLFCPEKLLRCREELKMICRLLTSPFVTFRMLRNSPHAFNHTISSSLCTQSGSREDVKILNKNPLCEGFAHVCVCD